MLYTWQQVQTEIDNLDDPRLTEKLSVQVDDEDRVAILKKVNYFFVYIYSILINYIYIHFGRRMETHLNNFDYRQRREKEGSRAT